MDFLQYIERSAENLQFYLWYRDYVKRFDALPESEKALSPPWTAEKAEAEAIAAKKERSHAKANAEATEFLKGTDFEPTTKPTLPENTNPFHTPPKTPVGEKDSMIHSTTGWSEDASTLRSAAADHTKKSAAAFEEAGALQPCKSDRAMRNAWSKLTDTVTIQPFRGEISRIIAIYIAEGSSRQLNLSAKEQSTVMKALSMTTHPTAFREVLATVEWTLRHQAHPNFIRWTICNGNPPRKHFARGLGIVTIILGIVYAIVITLSSANRGWRALAVLPWVVGTATLFAGWKGMCVVCRAGGQILSRR